MKWLAKVFVRRARPASTAPRRRIRLALEQLEERTVPTELVGIFSYGVYRYNDNQFYGPTGWKQLTTLIAQTAAITEQDGAGSYGVVVASFNGHGTYKYTDRTGWQQLTPAVASRLSIGGAYVVGEFPGLGVWRYDNYSGWHNLTTLDASQVSVDSAGEFVGDFAGRGVFRYDATGHWQQLTTADASQVAIAQGYVAAVFSFGTYRYEDGAGWRQLTTLVPVSMAMNAGGDVAGSFRGYGTYIYDGYYGRWDQTSTSVAAQVGITGDQHLAGEFNGVWLYDAATSDWNLLTSANAYQIAVGR